MIIKPNPSLGVPIYLQLVEQVKHAIETGRCAPATSCRASGRSPRSS